MPHTNHLIHEQSPYLQQHAHNPVDWYPWGPEALQRARREDKPIFLSIGYSTCHWCHVMEHESFENDSVAKILNEHFVSIKVDREERPDLDNLYMTATQAMTGSGGWPMTVILTPELKPYFAGTYFPPDDMGGRPGLKRVLLSMADAWQTRRKDVSASAEEVAAFLRASVSAAAGPGTSGLPGVHVLDSAYTRLEATFDPVHGGFGGAPKFPTPHQLTFLLHYWARTGNPHALDMARITLDQMARGGIHDQLGGGFHRYSTDRQWLAPHFEKMLYDQALLAEAYIEAWKATREPEFAAVARDVCDYVLRDLTDPGGGFRSAEDADSEGHEGRFYVWSEAEVDAVLGPGRGARFKKVYDITARGNWEGANIPRQLKPPAERAKEIGVSPDDLDREMARDRAVLLEVRSRRVRPHLDDKVLSGWNGLMIGAMARVGAALGEPAYVAAAERAAAFLDAHLVRGGRLLRRWHSGSADIPAYAEDYAYLSRGLLSLYEATGEARHLRRSLELARDMDRLFQDPHGGGYLFSGEGNEVLLANHKDVYDGATPSANSVAAGVLLRLGDLVADTALAARGERVLSTFGATVAESPQAYTEMLQALDFALGPRSEIVVAGSPGQAATSELLRAAHQAYLPNAVLAWCPPRGAGAETLELIPYLAAQQLPPGHSAAYVCQDYACKLPVTNPEAFSRELRSLVGAHGDGGPVP